MAPCMIADTWSPVVPTCTPASHELISAVVPQCRHSGRYHVEGFPLYTLSNWGWHTPDPAAYGVKQPVFNADGTLNYVYENVSINSADSRPGKGNRTVPYV